jgi:soluble lytic murein transglycosylase-like protein
MNEKNRAPHTFVAHKDAVVFCITVACCSFLLANAGVFSNSTAQLSAAMPELAMPQQTMKLVQLPRPAPLKVEPPLSEPSGDMAAPASTVKQPERKTEVGRMIASVPDRAIPFHGIIIQAAGRYEVDEHLIRAIILAESGYNPRAESKKGARGLMQLMPSTAKALGVRDIYDPRENIDGGVRYFRSLLDRFDGDVQLALAAYNAGSRHVRNYEGIPPFKATQLYIKKVLKFHKKFKLQAEAEYRRLA